MWTFQRKISPFSIRAKPSSRLASPARRDFTSGPVSTRPPSKVSRIWNLKEARRLRATTLRGMEATPPLNHLRREDLSRGPGPVEAVAAGAFGGVKRFVGLSQKVVYGIGFLR